jgi:LAO/AO transport system kinase
VGIIAVDPTSPFSGGALLGDRVRMRDLAGDPGVFIRSMATRGSLGGLARATGEVILVLDAAGFERILVETVGVGQAEVEIASAAHTTIVVEAPGLGDEVQAIKAGVLEIADLFAVNKADREGADHTVLALQMMQGLAPVPLGHHAPPPTQGELVLSESKQGWGSGRTQSGGHGVGHEPGAQPDGAWLPPIVKTVATRGGGIETLHDWIEAHRAHLSATGQVVRRETTRAAAALEHALRDALLAELLTHLPGTALPQAIEAVVGREMDPYTAAARLLTLARNAHHASRIA